MILYGMILLIAIESAAQIEGDIVDKKNSALPNVIVIASDSTGKTFDTVRSDERGFYEFLKLSPGKYIIEARAPGFVSRMFKNITVNAAPEGSNSGDDTYYAVSLDIVLTRKEISK